MYDLGQGVPKDYAQAAIWRRKAADHGYARAQAYLGLIYRVGNSVPKNFVLAHMWFNLAAASSNHVTRMRATAERDNVAGEMKPDQVAEAQRMASEWNPQGMARELTAGMAAMGRFQVTVTL
jgi:uncharacterized protein